MPGMRGAHAGLLVVLPVDVGRLHVLVRGRVVVRVVVDAHAGRPRVARLETHPGVVGRREGHGVPVGRRRGRNLWYMVMVVVVVVLRWRQVLHLILGAWRRVGVVATGPYTRVNYIHDVADATVQVGRHRTTGQIRGGHPTRGHSHFHSEHSALRTRHTVTDLNCKTRRTDLMCYACRATRD